jgi:hypothetical protein
LAKALCVDLAQIVKKMTLLDGIPHRRQQREVMATKRYTSAKSELLLGC